MRVRLRTGLDALSLSKEGSDDSEQMARYLSLGQNPLQAALEVLSMRAQYFRHIKEHNIEKARQMAYFVEQKYDAVHSKSYKTGRQALTTTFETESAKQLAKCRLGRSGSEMNKEGGCRKPAADSE